MTLTEINDMTLENNLWQVLHRLVNTTGLPEGEALYTLSGDESDTLLQSIIMHTGFAKPTLTSMNAELEVIKDELRVIENSRLAELARVEGINVRWNTIGDIRGAISQAGQTIRNPATELKRIIEENDQDALVVLEDASVVFQTAVTIKNTREARKKYGRRCREMCNEVMDIVAGWNGERSLTDAQKTEMQTTYAPILGWLDVNRPGKVKPLVEAITPDNIITTQEMKDELLETLDLDSLLL